MASIIDLPPLMIANPQELSTRGIRATSYVLKCLFGILCAVFVVLLLLSLWVVLFYRGEMIAFGPRGGLITTGLLPPDFIPFSRWRFDQRLAYVPVVLVRSTPAIGLLWSLCALFGHYARGRVFGRRNAALIKIMACFLLLDAVAPFTCHILLSVTGYEIDKVWAHLASLQELILGAVVFVIARVMQVGHEIEQDREGFV